MHVLCADRGMIRYTAEEAPRSYWSLGNTLREGDLRTGA